MKLKNSKLIWKTQLKIILIKSLKLLRKNHIDNIIIIINIYFYKLKKIIGVEINKYKIIIKMDLKNSQ